MRLSRPSYRPASDRPKLTHSVEPQASAEVLQRERCLLGLANATRVLLRHSKLSDAFPRALEHLRAALDIDRLYLCEHDYCDLPGNAPAAHVSNTAHLPHEVLTPPLPSDEPPINSSETSSETIAANHEGADSPEAQTPSRADDAEDDRETAHLGFSLIFEAVGNGAIAHSPRWQHWTYEQAGLRRWYKTFETRMPLGGILDDFPPNEQLILQQEKVYAALMVPIFLSETELWGYLGCENCHAATPWSLEEQSTLIAFADNLGSAIRRQRGEEQIQFQAFHDLLTGLPNRMLFNHRLPLAIAHARRTQDTLAVMFLDLDRFKQINDSLGHEYGDQLLIQATQRLQTCLREEDILARWGGDEFTLCLPNLQSSDDVIKIAQRLVETLRHPFQIEEKHLEISGSIGIALYPQDGEEIETLLRNADTALYRVKEEGRDHYQFFRPEMNNLASAKLSWGKALQASLHLSPSPSKKQKTACVGGAALPEPNQTVPSLQLYYQPLVSLSTGQVQGLETFLRWYHPQQGLLTATEFMHHAEQAGLMVDLGEWVIEGVESQLQQWCAEGICQKSISINLSTQQFHSSAMMAKIARMGSSAPETQFLLELSELSLCGDISYSRSVLNELKDIGIGVVLHQFGSHPVDLETLAQLPLHQLKLERRLIETAPSWEDPIAEENDDATIATQQRALLSTLLGIGQSLAIPIVAHGVESQAQLTLLRSLNYLEAQGNFLSPPLPAEDISKNFQAGNGAWTVSISQN